MPHLAENTEFLWKGFIIWYHEYQYVSLIEVRGILHSMNAIWHKTSDPSPNTSWLPHFRWAMFLSLLVSAAFVYGSEVVPFHHEDAIIVFTILSSIPLTGYLLKGMKAPPVWFSVALLSFDSVVITVFLHLTGGANNPFTSLYLAQIVLSIVVLGTITSLPVILFAHFGFLSLFMFPNGPHFDHHNGGVLSAHLIGMFFAFAITTLLITYFLNKVSAQRREYLAERESIKQLEQEQLRLASLTALTSQSAHELASPLSTIAICAGELSHSLREVMKNDDAILQDLASIQSSISKARSLLGNMTARGGALVSDIHEMVALPELARQIESDLQTHFQTNMVQVCTDGDAVVSLPKRAFIGIVHSLVKNAIDAKASDVVVCVTSTNDKLLVTVRDDGIGMSQPLLERLGQPFISSKSIDQGMGLGIFVAKLFCQNLRGSISFHSPIENSQGTEVTMRIPIQRSSFKLAS
ncbi:MAG: ATP-binding protein [Bdellovibrionales bacterium]|nr:ATP-binding protein [Bdellovibrionales bacterium]